MVESGFKFPKLVQKGLCSRKSKSIFCEDVTKIRYEDVDNKKMLGSGGFGDICAADYLGSKVILKVLTEAENEEIVREARFLQKLKHPNIAEFIGMELNKKTLIDQIEQIDHVRQGILSFLFFYCCLFALCLYLFSQVLSLQGNMAIKQLQISSIC